MMRVIACQTYAGGFDIGATNAGLTLWGKVEQPGGFGLPSCEANRRVLGDSWESQVGEPETWKPYPVSIVISNPPCSGFSSMSYGMKSSQRGIEARVNHCMRDAVKYAAACKPDIFIMESVQGAVVEGMPMMRELRRMMEELTGKKYDMIHMLQNNGALGGCSIRRRYFLILSRVKFGIELPRFGPPATLQEAIGDLTPLDYSTWGFQPYPDAIQIDPDAVRGISRKNNHSESTMSEWASRTVKSGQGGTDGHVVAEPSEWSKRVLDLIVHDSEFEDPETWPQGACMQYAMKKHYERYGKLPDSWHVWNRSKKEYQDKVFIDTDFYMGWNRPKRWTYAKPAHVVTGAAMYHAIHPTQQRFITNRECARIMGFPDDWRIEPLRGIRGMESYWGKGTSVAPAEFVCNWARRAVDGEPGAYIGSLVSDHWRLAKHGDDEREFVIDVSKVSKHTAVPAEEEEAEEEKAA